MIGEKTDSQKPQQCFVVTRISLFLEALQFLKEYPDK